MKRLYQKFFITHADQCLNVCILCSNNTEVSISHSYDFLLLKVYIFVDINLLVKIIFTYEKYLSGVSSPLVTAHSMFVVINTLSKFSKLNNY